MNSKQPLTETSTAQEFAQFLFMIAEKLRQTGLNAGYFGTLGPVGDPIDRSIDQLGKKLKTGCSKMVASFETNQGLGEEMVEFEVDIDLFRILIRLGRDEISARDALHEIIKRPLQVGREIEPATGKASGRVEWPPVRGLEKGAITASSIHYLVDEYSEEANSLARDYEHQGFRNDVTDSGVDDEALDSIGELPLNERIFRLTVYLILSAQERRWGAIEEAIRIQERRLAAIEEAIRISSVQNSSSGEAG